MLLSKPNSLRAVGSPSFTVFYHLLKCSFISLDSELLIFADALKVLDLG